MKYYILSPLGRTGSKRIFDPLSLKLNLLAGDYKRFSIPKSTDDRCVLMDRDQENVNYIGADGIDILDNWPSPIAIHSHNSVCMPTSNDDWKFILSARKRKIDCVLSLLIARNSQVYHPAAKDTKLKEGFGPFEADMDLVSSLMEDYIAEENAYVEKVRALGSEPIVIYMEDSFATVQEKLGISFKDDADVHDTHTISNLKAVDYVTNYDAIQSMYDENLTDYQSRFFTDTE
jgi:hypothetical protein